MQYQRVELFLERLLAAASKTKLPQIKRNADLPLPVRHALKNLPHAMETWRAAWNSAAKSGKYDESAAFQIAWAAIQHRYYEKNGKWHARKGWKPKAD